MRILVLTLCLLFSIVGFAFDWSLGIKNHEYFTNHPKLQPLLQIIKKTDKCTFAVAPIPRSSWDGYSNNAFWPIGAICIGDVVRFKDTLKESRGCTAFLMNGETLNVTPLNPSGPLNIVKKNCKEGGFEELIKGLVYRDWTVLNSLVKSKMCDAAWEMHLIRAPNEGFKNIFVQEKIKAEMSTRYDFYKFIKNRNLRKDKTDEEFQDFYSKISGDEWNARACYVKLKITTIVSDDPLVKDQIKFDPNSVQPDPTPTPLPTSKHEIEAEVKKHKMDEKRKKINKLVE